MTNPWPRRAFRLPWRAPSEIDAELDEELQYHLDQRTAELIARGLTPSAAREEALRRFGDLAGARAYCREVDRGRARLERRRDWLSGWGQDLRFALRQLVRTPGLTFIAILTIALGVGANTAIFSAVHRLLLDPLPYRGGDRLVALLESNEKSGTLVTPQSEIVAAWREKAHTLEGLETFDEKEVTLATPGAEPERLKAGLVTATLPRFLGVTVPIGRGFSPEETVRDGPRVAMLGYGLWQRRFGGQREVLGQTLRLDGEPYTIIGVMPRDFTLPFMMTGSARQLWLPLPPPREGTRVQAIGRLRPGITAEQATAELSSIEKAWWSDKTKGFEFIGKAIGPQAFLAGNLRQGLLVLFGVVGIVLLIACANVANLLLARAATRSHEFAVRIALGAGRGRLVRQLLTESTLLALIGGGLGVLLAWRGLDLLALARPASLSQLDDVRLQPVALAWSLGLTLLTGLLFGLAPALLATDRTLGDPLRGSSGGTRRSPRRFRSGLVILEVAMSVTLLVGAGLLVRTLRQMQRVDLGFSPEGLTAATLALPGSGEAAAPAGKDSPLDPVLGDLLRRVRALPGVTGAAYATGVPPQSGVALGELQVEGKPIPAGQAPAIVGYNRVAPEYFAVMGIPFRAGRAFDRGSDELSMVINETMARRYWPGEDPVGHRYRLGERGAWLTVVGVVPDQRIPGRHGAFDDLQSYARLTGGNDLFGQVHLVIRTSGDAGQASRLVRTEIAASGRPVQLARLAPVTALLDEVLAVPRFTMLLFAAFAGLALLLATIGLYGVISYSVSQRTREIGVRIALGAAERSVLGMVLGQGLRLTVAGVVLGLLGAAAATRAMTGMLYQVSPLDPLTFGLVAVGLVAVALFAAWLPARRAMRVDPVVALRSP